MENLNNQGDCDDDRKQLLDKYRDVQKLKNEEINSLRAELTKGREENEKLSCQLSAIVKDSEAKAKHLETEMKTLKEMNTKLAEKGSNVTFCMCFDYIIEMVLFQELKMNSIKILSRSMMNWLRLRQKQRMSVKSTRNCTSSEKRFIIKQNENIRFLVFSRRSRF